MALRVVIMLIMLLAGFFLSLRWPFWGVLLVAFWYFFRPEMWGAEFAIRPVFWWTLAAVIGYFLSSDADKSARNAWWLLGMLALMALSTAYGYDVRQDSWDRLWVITKLFAFCFLVLKVCDSPRRIAAFMVALLLGCLWISKAVLYGWAAQRYSADARVDKLVAQGGGANYIALLFVITLPLLVLGFLRASDKRLKIACLAGVGLWIASILATGSRGGFLGLVVVGIMLLITHRRFTALAGVTAIAAAFFLLAPPQFYERLGSITLDTAKMDRSSLMRWYNLNAGVEVMRNNPVFGIGFMNFPEAAEPYLPTDYPGIRGVNYSHNTYLQIGTENGIPALLFFLTITGVLLWRLAQPAPPGIPGRPLIEWVRHGTLVGLVALLVCSFFGDNAGTDPFWWFYAAGFTCTALYHGRTAEDESPTLDEKAAAPAAA